jgi:hypothetical protein
MSIPKHELSRRSASASTGWLALAGRLASQASARPQPTCGTIRLNITIHGYVVVDIPDPEGQPFELYCRSSKSACHVVTLVTPSGKPQSRGEGGYDGEVGTYKAIVVAAIGEADVYAETA